MQWQKCSIMWNSQANCCFNSIFNDINDHDNNNREFMTITMVVTLMSVYTKFPFGVNDVIYETIEYDLLSNGV